MRSPLVTISIPTFNSAKTLARCLSAIKSQTYKKIEINIVDKKSKDDTVKLVKEQGARRVKVMEGSLLEARYEGAKLAKGEFILILDSDQILERTSIERAIEMVQKEKLDMLAFEENVFKKDAFIEKLFDLDRKLINTVNDLSPFTGVIMPRFFKTRLLLRAYENVPKQIFPNTGGPDHAIVYYEAWKISKKISVLPNAIKHIEPETMTQLWPKFYRWGYTSVDAHFGKYKKIMEQKEKFRTGLFARGLVKESFGSILLLILKGIGFKFGYFVGKIDRKLGMPRKF